MTAAQAELDSSLVRNGWDIVLSNGRFVNLLDVRDEDIDIEVIAHSLSLQCRYMGHIKHHYSVAQHCCLVCDCITKEIGIESKASLAGLLHDASEAYLHDLVRAIKVGLRDEGSKWVELEHDIQSKIYLKYGVYNHDQYHSRIKKWDNLVLRDEVDQLFPPCPQFQQLLSDTPSAGVTIERMIPSKAKAEFLDRFERLWSLYKSPKAD